MNEQQFKRIVIFGLPRNTFHSGLLRGIARYARHPRRWNFSIHGDKSTFLHVLKTWNPDGVLIHETPKPWTGAFLRGIRIPTVYCGWPLPRMSLPCVGPDKMAIGSLAADHLLELGFRRFGYYGARAPYVRPLRQGFVERLRRAGFSCRILEYQARSGRRYSPEQRIESVTEWLGRFKFPVGIMVYGDSMGPRIADACARRGLRIPDDVAVVGQGNDEIFCQMMWPGLSSIDINSERIGYEAAAMLHRLMEGREVRERIQLIQPRGVVARGTTDTLAVEDPILATALRIIKEHCPDLVQIGDMARQVGVSRRSLEHHFTKSLGRSPAQEVRRMRIEHAKRLLRETNLKVTTVSDSCHFRTAKDFWRTFRRASGMSPEDYRRQQRGA